MFTSPTTDRGAQLDGAYFDRPVSAVQMVDRMLEEARQPIPEGIKVAEEVRRYEPVLKRDALGFLRDGLNPDATRSIRQQTVLRRGFDAAFSEVSANLHNGKEGKVEQIYNQLISIAGWANSCNGL